MELEEAIKELKRTIEENNRLLLPHNEQFFNKKQRQEIEQQNKAIETVLQVLENSIPKEKVKDNLECMEDYFYRLNVPDEDIEFIKEVKQKLLGEEKQGQE